MTHDTATLVAMMRRQLVQMDAWIDKAEAHAAAKKFDANVLLQARLAPDMMPLVRQYGSACDTAKFAAARLSGATAPSHPDDQTTWAQVRDRVRDVVAWLGDFSEDRFAGAAAVEVRLRFMPGKHLKGPEYLVHHSVPNFYFHCSMAYALLRHNGVDLGKADFLGAVPFRDDPTS